MKIALCAIVICISANRASAQVGANGTCVANSSQSEKPSADFQDIFWKSAELPCREASVPYYVDANSTCYVQMPTPRMPPQAIKEGFWQSVYLPYLFSKATEMVFKAECERRGLGSICNKAAFRALNRGARASVTDQSGFKVISAVGTGFLAQRIADRLRPGSVGASFAYTVCGSALVELTQAILEQYQITKFINTYFTKPLAFKPVVDGLAYANQEIVKEKLKLMGVSGNMVHQFLDNDLSQEMYDEIAKVLLTGVGRMSAATAKNAGKGLHDLAIFRVERAIGQDDVMSITRHFQNIINRIIVESLVTGVVSFCLMPVVMIPVGSKLTFTILLLYYVGPNKDIRQMYEQLFSVQHVGG